MSFETLWNQFAEIPETYRTVWWTFTIVAIFAGASKTEGLTLTLIGAAAIATFTLAVMSLIDKISWATSGLLVATGVIACILAYLVGSMFRR